ncbi:DUF1786 domain-containing protein [Dethiobacter alkaliphilus]|uniref:Protein of unkown function DUF1786 putative pyruvate format-lyase activating enzyme n=1 Tax=Dethiobacter alkaliphilus AHT 1 TaxID=555088 RepID=C0GKM6_DETAL|nr:DUF1786 domain-containing protein [Dethiobacter alkaliphilus]EEG76118.1 protein of unkown function DUF1786; putative pyruvate format-lyase activating enzyme [Dethiobacter alkaliphilus AHT 1]
MAKLMAIDIGGGTQDILLYDSDKTLENCIQLILPSPTVLVAQQIKKATEAGKAVFLHGHVMGGGPSTKAVRDHLSKGLPVFATKEAALTIHDDPKRVESLGVVTTEDPPAHAVRIHTGDIDREMLARILGEAGEDLPAEFAVAVQDHGYSPGESNRIFRFRIWEQFMAAGGKLSDLVYGDIPSFFTRMEAARKQAPGALLMDTCGAALLGALTDERVREASGRGTVAVINLGNQHTFAALVEDQRVIGLFEHHTGMMTPQKVAHYLKKLTAGKLSNAEVQEDQGHGCLPPAEEVDPVLTVVTGPRRSLLSSLDCYFAAPQGNMMLMGCFGLVDAANL